jgi:hypothetical protein
MTKRETNFADDDRAMARRALWLLDGNPPSGEPAPTLDLDRLLSHQGEDGFLVPLARFGLTRHWDATSDKRPKFEPQNELNPTVARSQERLRIKAEACLDEKKAEEALRESGLGLQTALECWRRALERRAEDYARVPERMLTGKHLAVLGELLVAEQALTHARVAVEHLRRHLAPPGMLDSFPSTLGLPKTERNSLLNAQALQLSRAGHSLDEIAYVMAWDAGTPEQARDRTRKRLDAAAAVDDHVRSEE